VIAFTGADQGGAGTDLAALEERVHRKAGAEQLEGVETEAAGLVLGKETSDT
jgi:hypothetical protein